TTPSIRTRSTTSVSSPTCIPRRTAASPSRSSTTGWIEERAVAEAKVAATATPRKPRPRRTTPRLHPRIRGCACLASWSGARAPGPFRLGGMSLAKPILIFDGDCGFCRRSAARFLEMTQGRVEARPSQSLDLEALGVDPATVKRAVVFVAPEGDPTEGSEAIFRALMHAPGRRFRWGARMGLLPCVLPVSQVGYR